MNRADYMAALRRALSVLPEEERANALRYYEEYFDDAGPENEAKAIEELGEPAKVAAQILADYRELTAVPHAQPIKEKRRWRGISPLLLIVLVLLAIPIGLPLVFGAGATVLGVLLAIIVTVLAVIFAVLLILYGIPLALICGGAVITVLSCTLWATPANALGHTRQRTGCLCRRYPARTAVHQAEHSVCAAGVPRLCRRAACAV